MATNVGKRIHAFLAKPWLLETLFFFAVLWQESFRLSSRTLHRVLPVGSRIQDFYYYHFGDFVNGFVIAYVFDGLANLALFGKTMRPGALHSRIPQWAPTLCAVLVSALVITAHECGIGSMSTTSDLSDIPAGVLGALVYCMVRLFALHLLHSKPTNGKSQ
jgi:hypothetical protein